MMLLEIKAAAAAYLGKATQDLTVNDVDLGLIALNQVRLDAELNHDFEFSRKLVTVQVDSVVGGSLDSAVIMGTQEVVSVKSPVDVGLFNPETGDLMPVDWTTTEDSLNQQRMENPNYVPRYPTDGQAVSGVCGSRRFVFSGTSVYFFPRPTEHIVFTLGIEAYLFTTDWTRADIVSDGPPVGGPWTTRGQQFLQWGAIIHLNHLFKEFVGRQEGNLAPPQAMADRGLANLISWDIFKYEQSRRHKR